MPTDKEVGYVQTAGWHAAMNGNEVLPDTRRGTDGRREPHPLGGAGRNGLQLGVLIPAAYCLTVLQRSQYNTVLVVRI